MKIILLFTGILHRFERAKGWGMVIVLNNIANLPLDEAIDYIISLQNRKSSLAASLKEYEQEFK